MFAPNTTTTTSSPACTFSTALSLSAKFIARAFQPITLRDMMKRYLAAIINADSDSWDPTLPVYSGIRWHPLCVHDPSVLTSCSYCCDLQIDKVANVLPDAYSPKSVALYRHERDEMCMRQIGRGRCGVVFELPGRNLVVKREIKSVRDDGVRRHDLYNDGVMHQFVELAFEQVGITAVCVPRYGKFMWAEEIETKASMLRLLDDEEFEAPANLLHLERIPPLPLAIREALTEIFYFPHENQMVRDSQENMHCLIQPCMGKQRETVRSLEPVSLRDFELCADQMEDLSIDKKKIAGSVAEALAVMYWIARVDARGVEFVFGGRPQRSHDDHPPANIHPLCSQSTPLFEQDMNLVNRDVQLWLLDFNDVSPLPEDWKENSSRMLSMLVTGFVKHPKSIYPRPAMPNQSAEDVKTWRAFRHAYVQTCIRIGFEHEGLCFIDAIEEHYYWKAGIEDDDITDDGRDGDWYC